MADTRGARRAWGTVAALSLIMAGSIGILTNTTGVVFNAILTDLNFRSGDLSIYYTVRQLAGAGAVFLTARFFRRPGAHRFVALLCALQALGIGAFALCGKVWHWYLLALLTCFGQGSMHTICALVVANWFQKRGGLAIGIAMSFSGMAGALSNLLVSRLILALGWRATVLWMMGAALLVTVPASLLLRVAPEELGLRPYGAQGESGGAAAPRRAGLSPTLRRQAQRQCVVFAVGVGVCLSLTNQLALFGKSLGLSLAVAAYMQSCAMVGNLGGKLLIGILADRLGAFPTMRMAVALIFCALAGFLGFDSVPAALYLSSGLLGLAYATYSTQSVVYQAVFGAVDGKAALTRMMALCGAVNALYSMLAGYFYDLLGSFGVTYALAALLCALQLLSLRRLKRIGAAS